MTSDSLQDLNTGIAEVWVLQAANPSPTGAAPGDPATTRVIGRASVILLCSHYERYHYSAVEEVVEAINTQALEAFTLPEAFRLRQTRSVVEELAKTKWTNRAEKLEEFVRREANLWAPGRPATMLDASRPLEAMTSPKPDQLVRVYQQLAIDNVFAAITRTVHTKGDLRLQLSSLVDKRNSIAHGDRTEQATQADVYRYRTAIRTFCERVDRLIPRVLRREIGLELTWY